MLKIETRGRNKDLSLTRHRILTMPKVLTFLESIERNSKNTRSNYHLGLACFQNYLDANSNSNSSVKIKLDLETVLPLLSKNKMDVYELLDGFLSYLMKRKAAIPSPNSTSVVDANYRFSVHSMLSYLTAVRIISWVL